MYVVERIVDKKIDPKTKKELYLIKWEGYHERQNTWEPRSHLISCQELLNNFQRDYDQLYTSKYGKITLRSKKAEAIEPKKTKLIKKSSKKEQIYQESESGEIAPQKFLIVSEQEEQSTFSEGKIQEQIDINNRVVKILKMQTRGPSTIFLVKVGKHIEWKTRNYVFSRYPKQLCLFYEKKI